MKKDLVIIAIVVLFLSSVGLGVTTVYFYSQYNDATDKIKQLEKEIDKVKEESKQENYNMSSSSNKETSNNKEEEKETTNGNISYESLFNVDVGEIEDMIEMKKSFILLVSQTGCGHCKAYKPILASVLEDYNIQGFVLEYNLLDDAQKEKFNDIASVSGTPTVLFFKDGKETNTTDRLIGEHSKEETIKRLEQMGYTK